MTDDEYDERLEHRRARDTALQAVVDDLARRSRGRPEEDVRAELRRTLAEEGLPEMPEGWLDAVASAATIGDPYVVSSHAERVDDVPPAQERHPGYGVG